MGVLTDQMSVGRGFTHGPAIEFFQDNAQQTVSATSVSEPRRHFTHIGGLQSSGELTVLDRRLWRQFTCYFAKDVDCKCVCRINLSHPTDLGMP